MADIPQGLIEKISKLLALTETAGATENEAAVAAAKAQRLLEEYNLSEAAVRGAHVKGGIVIKKLPYIGPTSRRSAWEVELHGTICGFMFCANIFTDRDVWFVGRKLDVEAASAVFSSLQFQLYWLAEKRTREHGEQMKARWPGIRLNQLSGYDHPKVWRNSWMSGAIDGIRAAMRLQRKTQIEVSPNLNAIISLRAQEVDEFVKESIGKLGSWDSHRDAVNGRAYNSGFEDGKSLKSQRGDIEGSMKQLEG